MSASAARQTANAANAQLSTGPRTPEGKACSSQNARKHGLSATQLLIGPEDREEFDDMLADYQSDVAPQGAIQQTLCDQLVASAWNLRRVRRMEVQLHSDTTDDDELQKKLDRLARHKTRIERTFHRSLKELKALQTNAVIQATLPSEVRRHVPTLSNAAEISKRTQKFEERKQLEYIKAVMDAPIPDAAYRARQANGHSDPSQ